MPKLSKTLLAASLAALALTSAPAPAFAEDPAMRGDDAAKAAFEEDRATILSMAGDYAVTFDMRETTPWLADYKPIDGKISGGYESVRVVEDTGSKIALQHLLVVGPKESPYVVKHWRQDWEYQPNQMLTFSGGDTRELTDVPEAMRAGSWSQPVYQVDDSPRYAGIGTWRTVEGIETWVSNRTARPLARRDAVREPIYDRYFGVNRHQISPVGWIHWQDNMKLMSAKDGSDQMVPVVQESVLNTYERYDGYNVAAAEDYWSNTESYWAAIRAKWDEVSLANCGIQIEQNPEVGTSIAGELLKMADAIKNGEATSDEATATALAMIEEGTSSARGGG